MSELVQLSRNNGIAVITINNPPVNALSPGVPEGIADAIENIEKDDGVTAAVLIGGGKTFVPGAEVGQPEVKLGIIPGAAGTQRLPRLAGVAKAVEMCAEGNPVKVEEALKAGIVDRLIEGDLLTGAIAFAREVAGKPARKTRERNEKLGSAEQNAAIFAAARENVRKKMRGQGAPRAAIEAIETATRLPFEQGCEAEQKLFMQCLFSDQSKSLIHVFFGE